MLFNVYITAYTPLLYQIWFLSTNTVSFLNSLTQHLSFRQKHFPDRLLSITPIPSAMASSSSNVVGVHYRVGKKIGEGSFGVIFEGTNLLNSQQVAIKFVCSIMSSETYSAYWQGQQEPRKSDAPQLRDEYRTYKILVGCRKFTKL